MVNGGRNLRDLLVGVTGNPSGYTNDDVRALQEATGDDPMTSAPSQAPGKKPCNCDDEKPYDPCFYMKMTDEQKLKYRCDLRTEAYNKAKKCADFLNENGACIKKFVKRMLPKKKAPVRRRTYKRKATYKRKTATKKKPATKRRRLY